MFLTAAHAATVLITAGSVLMEDSAFRAFADDLAAFRQLVFADRLLSEEFSVVE